MATSDNKVNLVFMAHMQYPHGMASTRIIQQAIDYLNESGDFDIKVLVLRQGRVQLADAPLSGQYKGTEYVTIGSDIKPNTLALFKAVKYFWQGMAYLKNSRKDNHKNIIYVYGYPSTDNFPLLVFARLLGYKIVFYIVEDISVQAHAPDIFARLKSLSARYFYKRLAFFADAVLVISSHLYEKTKKIAKDKFTVTLHPISVDFANFDFEPGGFGSSIRLFYGGTFEEKDGVENLIRAFEIICSKHNNVQLILTGKGSDSRMEIINQLIAQSPYAERIKYKGYLDDNQYYELLNSCDIMCMTRTASAFADTGFPFKLGEYLATGKPVIASNVSDVSRYLEDKLNALLIEPDSVKAIAGAVDFLLTDPDKAGQIGTEGRKCAKQNFDSRILGEKLRQILCRLTAKKNTA